MSTLASTESAAPGRGSFEDVVRGELVRHLYRQAMVAILGGSLPAGFLLTFALWSTVDRAPLLWWLFGHLSVCVLRFALIGIYFWRAPSPQSATRWAFASAAGSLLGACFWALACILFFDPAQPLTVITITVILFALAAGSATIQSFYLLSFWMLVGPLMGTLISVLLWHGDPMNNTLALLAVFTSIAYFVAARNAKRLHTDSLRLGYENVALRREAEDKTRLLEATLRNMRQGISMTDAQGCLRMWNPQLVELMGLADVEIREGRPMQAVLGHARPPLDLGNAQRIEHHRHDGGVIEVTQNAMPDGGRVITYSDITDLKRREMALEAARRTAEQANAAKTRFLAAASHDLRQPIHALGLLFATLADRVRDEKTAPLLEHIDDAVQAVDAMLNSLLDISKLDAGVVAPKIASVDVAALLRRLNNEQQPIAKSSGNRLRIRVANAVARSDASMLHQILGNLISNALRYTHNGRVLVGARIRGDSIRIDVFDTGPGIPPESLDEIFLEFHQLGNPERDRRRGLGLGLAIVKRLAELLGHKLEVRSVVRRGSRFSITLPLSLEPQQARQHSGVPALQGADVQGRRVLVLDDEVSVLEATQRLLERWGCEVITAATPEEAEARLAAEPDHPDLLIVDYRLRRHASGIDAIGRLCELAGKPIPALIMTGDTAPDRLREAQASGYPLLHKPVMPGELRTAMRQIILENASRRDVPKNAE